MLLLISTVQRNKKERGDFITAAYVCYIIVLPPLNIYQYDICPFYFNDAYFFHLSI